MAGAIQLFAQPSVRVWRFCSAASGDTSRAGTFCGFSNLAPEHARTRFNCALRHLQTVHINRSPAFRAGGRGSCHMNSDQIKVSVIAYPDRKFLVMRISTRSQASQRPDPQKQPTGEMRSEPPPNGTELQRAATMPEPDNLGRVSGPPRQRKTLSLSPRTTAATDTAFNHLERLINPAKLSAVHAASLSRFQAELRTGVETTIATHLRQFAQR